METVALRPSAPRSRCFSTSSAPGSAASEVPAASSAAASETEGVPVIGYRADAFPAFWSRNSGLPCPLRLDEAAVIARLWRTRRALQQDGGVLIANPVPEADEIPAAEMEAHIARALTDADAAGVKGKDVTPFLLSRILELTDGASLTTNIALVKNNARLAAEIAVALAD